MPEDELALWEAFRKRGDAGAKAALVARYSRLVKKIAWPLYKSANFGYADFRDFIQIGTVGLLEAMSRYDPAQGVSFVHYSGIRIRGAILNGLEHQSEFHAQAAFRRRVRSERAESLAKSEKVATRDVVFMEMVDLAVGLAVGYMLEDTAMYAELHGTGEERAIGELSPLSLTMFDLAAQLKPSERQVVELHYMHGLDFVEVAKAMSLSKGRISQLHAQALKSLRDIYRRKSGTDLQA